MKVLDNDHWVAVLRGQLDLRHHVVPDEELSITAISVGKLVYGAERSARSAERLLELDTLLASVTVLAYEDQAAHRFGTPKAALERRGERPDDADLQVAAIALSRDGVLITHYGRHFARIPGLSLDDWLG